MKNCKKLPAAFLFGALLTANGAIVIALMHLVFHFINMANSSVAFLKSEVTITLMFILAVISAITAASVLIIIHYRGIKSYFFRKVAYTTFWICIFSILFQKNVILPDLIVDDLRNAVWFLVSIFTIINSVFCNGLLVSDYTKDETQKPSSQNTEQ